jgi:hypothetical protein
MNKTFWLFVILYFSTTAMSQEIQLNPYAGYFMGGRLNGYDADALFDNGPDFWLGLSYGVGRGKNIEVSYTAAVSSAALERDNTGGQSDQTDMNFGYIQIGYVQDFPLKKMEKDLRPFLLVTIGAAYLNPKDDDYETAWRFATAFGGGLKYFFTDRIGIRVQGRLLLPFFFSGAGFYCGTGGCGTSVESFSSLAQGAFDGGIIIKFGEE